MVRIRTAALCLVLAGCAVPVPPSGGPPDDQPPGVTSTDPPDGTVNVSPDRVRIRFDEYINPRTASQAVTVTPAPDRPPEIRPSGRGVDVVFREPLRANTTYIVSIDTGLQDAHGVALSSPIRVAFATGPRINRGRLSGRVLRASDGAPDAGIDVYAYLRPAGGAPQSMPDAESPPEYRTQSGTDGRFSFDYLQETDYFVMGMGDANRNRMADPGERVALPPVATVRADTTGLEVGVWVSVRADSTAPLLRRAAAQSRQRIQLSFDERVRILDDAIWALADSATGSPIDVLRAYSVRGDSRSVVLVTGQADVQTLRLEGSGVADSTGNVASFGPEFIPGTPRPDTLRARFEGFRVDTLATNGAIRILRPGSFVALAFTAGPDPANLQRGVAVTDTSGAGLEWQPSGTSGTLIGIQTGSTGPYDVRVDLAAFAGPDSTAHIRAQVAGASRLGELAGVIRPAAPYLVLARSLTSAARYSTRSDSSGVFTLSGLPGTETVALTVIEDRNNNGRWDSGRLGPFGRAEPVGWLGESPRVRARWETVLPDTLRILDVSPVSPDTTGGPP